MYQGGLSRTGSANNSNGFSPVYRKVKIFQSLRSCSPVGQPYMIEYKKSRRRLLEVLLQRLRIRFSLLFGKHRPDPVSAGHGFRHGHDQVSQFYKLYQNL